MKRVKKWLALMLAAAMLVPSGMTAKAATVTESSVKGTNHTSYMEYFAGGQTFDGTADSMITVTNQDDLTFMDNLTNATIMVTFKTTANMKNVPLISIESETESTTCYVSTVLDNGNETNKVGMSVNTQDVHNVTALNETANAAWKGVTTFKNGEWQVVTLEVDDSGNICRIHFATQGAFGTGTNKTESRIIDGVTKINIGGAINGYGKGNYFNGEIGNIRVYNSALATNDIKIAAAEALNAAKNNVTLQVGETVSFTVDGAAVTDGVNTDIADVTATTSRDTQATVGSAISSDTVAFEGETINVRDCLYTFEKQNDGSYVIWATTADGRKAYVVPSSTTVQQPNQDTSEKVTVTSRAEGNKVSLSKASATNCWLYFHYKNDSKGREYFYNNNGSYSANWCDYELFKKSSSVENGTSTEGLSIIGYEKVTYNQIEDGEQYLIARAGTNNGGSEENSAYYIMHPSLQDNGHTHVAKVTGTEENATTYTEVTITAKKEGTTSFTVGGNSYYVYVQNATNDLVLVEGEDYYVTDANVVNNGADIVSVTTTDVTAPYTAVSEITGGNYVITNLDLYAVTNEVNGVGLKSEVVNMSNAEQEHVWTVNPVEGKENVYTIQDTNGKYLCISPTSGSYVKVVDTPQEIQIKNQSAGSTGFDIAVLNADGNVACNLNSYGGATSGKVMSYKETNYYWNLYKVSDTKITATALGKTTITVDNVNYNVTVLERFDVVVGSAVNGTTTESIAKLTGGGVYYEGDVETVTVTAPVKVGYEFMGWYAKEVAGTDYTGKTALSTAYSYTFDVADADLVAVYKATEKLLLTITDTENVTVDGVAATDIVYKEAGKVTVAYTGNADDFLYWMNASGKIVNTETTYTFNLVNNTTLTPVAKSGEANKLLVEYVNEYNQVLSTATWTAVGTLSNVKPSKLGYNCVGWALELDATEAITADKVWEKSAEGHVRLYPVYEKAATLCNVTYNDGTGSKKVEVALGETYTVTAGTVAGQTFNCWKMGETVVSYNPSYTFLVTGDVTVTAEFTTDAVAKASILEITSQYEIKNGETVEKVAFVASREIAEGYTLLEHGMLYARNSEITDTNAFVEGADGVNKFTATGTGAKGALTLNVKLNGATSIKVRAYAIVKNDTTGEVTTLYSDMATYPAQQ